MSTEVELRRAVRGLGRDRRGNVALLTASAAPMLLMAAGIGVEVSHWAAVKLELQRTADLAALAGATEYAAARDDRKATDAAVNLAGLNHAAADQVAASVRNNGTEFMATVHQAVPLVITRIISERGMSEPSKRIEATGIAKLTPSPTPCVLGLHEGGESVSAQGSGGNDGFKVELTGCSIRSNGDIAAKKNVPISASAFYAMGEIGDGATGGPRIQVATKMQDPYLGYAPLQAALREASDKSGPLFDSEKKNSSSQPPTVSSGWNIKSDVTLAPGIYYVNGNISLDAHATLSGEGVTIIASGALSMNGDSSLTLSAADSDVNGAIPGVVFAGSSKLPSKFHGGSSPSLTGVVYYPNGALDFRGGAKEGSKGCLQVVADRVTFRGNSTMASDCSRYGNVFKFPSGPALVTLFQ